MRFGFEDFKKLYCKEKPKPVDQKKLSDAIQDTNSKMGQHGFIRKNDFVYDETIKFIASRKIHAPTKGLAFIGPPGTGKTVACQLLAAFIDQFENQAGIKANIFYAEDMVNEFKQVSDKNKDEWINDVLKSDTLIIDDLGDEDLVSDYGNKYELLSRVLAKRYLDFKKKGNYLIISTNLNHEKLTKKYGARIYSRIMEMCILVDSRGDDIRAETKEFVINPNAIKK